MPLVSVITPVYNIEEYLPDCVESILCQTFADFELILVDDGSTDHCGAICDEYAVKDPRIRVIHQKNSGVSEARNTGLDCANGTYIAFCDSDDCWEKEYLCTLLEAMRTNHVDMVVSNFKKVDVTGETQDVVKHTPGLDTFASPEEKVKFILSAILGGKQGWEVWTRLFRANIICENKIRFNTNCENYAEDLGFVLQYCLYAESSLSLDYCGYRYLLRGNSMMRRSASVIKINQKNEVSKQFCTAYYEAFPNKKLQRWFPLIHFLIMKSEYLKLAGTPEYVSLPNEISKIVQKAYHRRQTKRIRNCYRVIVSLYGKKAARQILLLSHFCLHGNWRRFQLESAVAYRWFIK